VDDLLDVRWIVLLCGRCKDCGDLFLLLLILISVYVPCRGRFRFVRGVGVYLARRLRIDQRGFLLDFGSGSSVVFSSPVIGNNLII